MGIRAITTPDTKVIAFGWDSGGDRFEDGGGDRYVASYDQEAILL